MSEPIARRKPTTLDKLKVMVRQARCPLCNGKLQALDETEFDHVQALVNGGEDTIENLRAVHADCHKAKTFGRGGERRVTTAGGDLHTRDKVARLAEETEEFRRAVLSKGKPKKGVSEPTRTPGGLPRKKPQRSATTRPEKSKITYRPTGA